MYIRTTLSEADFDHSAAELILTQMKSNPRSVIGLSTGRTTGAMHRILAELWKSDPFDISGITFFEIDEVTGIPASNPWACCTKLRAEVLDALGVTEQQFLTFPTKSDDQEAAGRRFVAELERRGGADLIILGLGENGHLGFNQPGTPFDSRMHLSTMDDDLERRIREDCGMDPSVKLGGITLGLSELMSARRLVLAVKGASKAGILEKVVKGPVTEDIPASILQKHEDCMVLTDDKCSMI